MTEDITTTDPAEALAAQQAEEARAESVALLATAESFAITTDAEYTESGGLLREIVAKKRAVETTRKGITEPMDAAKKRVMDLFRPGLDMLAKAEATLKSAMVRFTQAQEAERRAEQARLDDLARKERERLEARAERHEEKGHTEQADVLRETAAQVAAPGVAPVTKAEGVALRTTWSAEVTDKLALIQAVAEGRAPLEYLEANMAVLHAMARASKQELAIPGVRAVASQGIAARA